MIRLTVPSIENDDIQNVIDVLKSGYLVQGEKVLDFEQQTANYVGAKYAIAMSNCTAALHLSLLCLEIKTHDLVIVPAYSWIATANVVELCGAQPIFVDIEPNTFNINPEMLHNKLTELMANKEQAKRVKAIIIVHAFGQMANMRKIMNIAERYSLPVVEDAACALGAKFDQKSAGTWGIAGCFSFHPRKAITTGEGGIIVTDNIEFSNRLRALRNHGINPNSLTTDFVFPGFNCRMTEFQAALGISQLLKIEKILAARKKAALYYDEILRHTLFQTPYLPSSCTPTYQSYVVLLPRLVSKKRQMIIQLLKNKGIETTIGTWHMPLTTYFRSRYGYQPGDFPATDDVFDRSLTLPLHEHISQEEQEFVIHELTSIVQKM
jgi:perosamine synthetase